MSKYDFKSNVLNISTEKGGVGKTTISSYIAEWAARFLKMNVLLVDTDIQCNLTSLMIGLETISLGEDQIEYKVPPVHPAYDPENPEVPERPSIADAFWGETIIPYNTWINNQDGELDVGNVDILPAHGADLEQVAAMQPGDCNIEDPIYDSIFHIVHSDEISEHYHLVVLDTNPTRNVLSRSALRACTDLVIPFELDALSYDGFLSMNSAVKAENSYRERNNSRNIHLVGLLPNRYVAGSKRTNGLSKTLYEEMKNDFDIGELFYSENSFIPQAEVAKKLMSGKHSAESVFDVNKKSKLEYRFRMAVEHACIETLSKIFVHDELLQKELDSHRQRVRREQKKL